MPIIHPLFRPLSRCLLTLAAIVAVMPAAESLPALGSLPAAGSLPPGGDLRALSELSGKTTNAAPAWARGTLIYRVSTPDDPQTLAGMEQGIAMVHHLLDGSIAQLPIANGLIGHDHPGMCNWDGAWPYWNRVTYRAKDWATLADFMRRMKDRYRASLSFHVNLTDVNRGMRDYPETREFFNELVAAGATYLRDRDPKTNRLSVEPPRRLSELPGDGNPIDIIALVDYQRFWDSGLAKRMIDGFYAKLPFAPPILYLDVLTLNGGNFSAGYPDGPLGGGEASQRSGVRAIADYLVSKGTDLATEGDRPVFADRSTYGWLHCQPGISDPDYRRILGATDNLPLQHVAGNTGGFNVSGLASTAAHLTKVREYYRLLLQGRTERTMPGLDTWRIADRGDAKDEFSIGGCADRYRGDWIDLVDNFYLTGIQELYHIGTNSVRTHSFSYSGRLHFSRFTLDDGKGGVVSTGIGQCWREGPQGRLPGNMPDDHLMLIAPIVTKLAVAAAGPRRLVLHGNNPGNGRNAVQVCVDGKLRLENDDIVFHSRDDWDQAVEMGSVDLAPGEHTIMFTPGPLRMEWSDGTVAEWREPTRSTGLRIANGDVVFAVDYDRMWPDTWSGQRKIHFFSWDGTARAWKLPKGWDGDCVLYPLTPEGRGTAVPLTVRDRTVAPKLLPRVPYVLVPKG